MSIRRSIPFLLALLTFLAAGSAPGSGQEPERTILQPPGQGMYHAAFPDFGGPESFVTRDRLRDFERLVDKEIAWAYFSDNWFNGISFPSKAVEVITDYGRVPFIRMMARSNFKQKPSKYTLQKILDGNFDDDLHAWCGDARDSGAPLLVEFGTEVNGFWFPWNGRWNGGGEKGDYGDPDEFDGPERFRDTYRHIVDICRAEGAWNITWFFHPNGESWPQTKWNEMAEYYPGDDYVDWIGVSVYGPQKPGESWTSFQQLMDEAYPKIGALAPDKPLALLEFGAAQEPHNEKKARWVRAALETLRSGRYPGIVAESYWHESWRNPHGPKSNLRLDSSPRTTRYYRREVRRSFYVTEPTFGPSL